jgi:hypothetical protein
MENMLPGLINKTISFKRMNSKHVKGYEIYGLYPDSNYTSGIRKELERKIDNPTEPNVDMTSISLEYNPNATWELPADMFTDRDHKFRLYINNFVVSSLYYQYNKYTRLLTLDTNLKPITVNDTFRLEYYRDRIKLTLFGLEKNCTIEVVPIYADTYTYGNHNVII